MDPRFNERPARCLGTENAQKNTTGWLKMRVLNQFKGLSRSARAWGFWLSCLGLSAAAFDPPVMTAPHANHNEQIAVPPRRDMARMGLERKFFEDIQREVDEQYSEIQEYLPGLTYSTWKDLSSKVVNVMHRLHESHKAMGVYRAALKRAAVIGTFASYTIVPAMVGGLTGNPGLATAISAIPWEIPFIPLWVKLEKTKQRQWLRWKLWGSDPREWNMAELEALRRKILEVDPENRIFSAVFETSSREARNYSFNVVKDRHQDEEVIATNAVTYQELEEIVRYAKNGEKFLFQLQSKRGPYPHYAAMLLRIIDEDDNTRPLLKSLLMARVPNEDVHPYKQDFMKLETLRAELNLVSWEIVERMNKALKGLPLADRPPGFTALVKNEAMATQNIFRHILLREHRYLLEIHAGRKPSLGGFLGDIREVLVYQNRFLTELNLPFKDKNEFRDFAEKIMAWKKEHPGPEMRGMDCESFLQKAMRVISKTYENFPASRL
jgi:hypothetical protein